MSLLSLPIELINQIISNLDPSGLVSLTACDNHDLVLNHERRLYNRERTRDKALVASCSLGLLRVIRRLVLDYGAPVSSVPMKALPMSTLMEYYGKRHKG
jgi:hypothetical protein